MESIIKAAVERGASDIHIKAGDVFRARIEGKLQPLTKQRLTPEQTREIALKVIPNKHDRSFIDSIKDYDCSWGAAGIGRFRVNILKQRSSFMIVMRVIPFEVPTIEKLGLPKLLETIVEAERGLMLVTGSPGNGKSSTIAALVNYLNATHNKHIVMLEAPIEFLHRDMSSSVTQREVGTDTEGFAGALHAALHQDADVIVVDQMLDPEMLEAAIRGAETGRLVIATLPTPDAVSTIARLAVMFPATERDIGRLRVADSLHAVVSQKLIPLASGEGRRAALEILICNSEIRELIRDRKKVADILSVMAQDGANGMQTFAQHLNQLAEDGVITSEAAEAATSKSAGTEAEEVVPKVRARSETKSAKKPKLKPAGGK